MKGIGIGTGTILSSSRARAHNTLLSVFIFCYTLIDTTMDGDSNIILLLRAKTKEKNVEHPCLQIKFSIRSIVRSLK